MLWESSELTESSPALPRWHPARGISDLNPEFRTHAPVMNAQGYASLIWRNVRKRNKPSLWRHALRTYDRMHHPIANQTAVGRTLIEPRNTHHEGALLACAKLGLWERALAIFETVKRQEHEFADRLASRGSLSTSSKPPKRMPQSPIHVTDSMILSLIRAAVRAVRNYRGETTSENVQDRRKPLDHVVQILLHSNTSSGNNHSLSQLQARHLNPLAAAYQSLGLVADASAVLDHLVERTSGPEAENREEVIFNVHDIMAKDKASYSLLVRGAVSNNDWVAAVNSLRSMTEAGLYPSARHLNTWTEVSERKTKQRTTRSWKKKRDEIWLESV